MPDQSPPTLPIDLGDGLVLRHATTADTESLVAFNADVHRGPGSAEPDAGIGGWVRDLLRGEHPTVAPGDFLLVEDTRNGAIASSVSLISQTWAYDGIPFGVGRPELVGTAPEYRERGLVRRQFEILHAWSAARGELVQAITGIPWYYRQFGYEHGGLALGGSRGGFSPQVPVLPEGTAEPYRVRPATEADLPLVQRLVAHGDRRSLVAAVRDEALWRYELLGQGAESAMRREWRVIETPSGEMVGILGHAPRLWGGTITADPYELAQGVSWAAVTPTVVRYLAATGREYAARAPRATDGPQREWDSFAFNLGHRHPVYDAIPRALPRVNPPYAYFVRVPDLPRFIRLIAPALERRLVGSALDGHSGDLTISFYRSGLRLAFEGGRLTAVEPWRPTVADGGKVAFPGLTFLQLLFCYRSLDELRHMFPDCWVSSDESQALLNTLFPLRASHVMAIS